MAGERSLASLDTDGSHVDTAIVVDCVRPRRWRCNRRSCRCLRSTDGAGGADGGGVGRWRP